MVGSYAVPSMSEFGLGVEIDEAWLIAATEEGVAVRATTLSLSFDHSLSGIRCYGCASSCVSLC